MKVVRSRYLTRISKFIKHQSRIKSIIEEDKSGTHKESLKKILYAIVESPRRLLITRDIIQYLGKHDFKDNK